jgi:5-(carboxyamino)imidazole ribonucleotide mutase
MSDATPLVGILMGSQSDWETMKHAGITLDQLGVANESLIISAHRKPKRLADYVGKARERGL